MKIAIALFALVTHFTAADDSKRFLICEKGCLKQISSKDVCKKCCERLVNATGAANNTNSSFIPPIPTSPRLVSHTFTTITVQWVPPKKEDRHKNVPVLYVLEVERETRVSDPLIILPFLQRYHVVSSTAFTSPTLESKSNYSMRVASVSMHGTKGFSAFSPYYQTNETCKVYELRTNVTLPCPVTNIRLRVTAQVVVTSFSHLKQRMTSWLYWDPPQDIHLLPEEKLEIKISLLSHSVACHQYGLDGRSSRYASKLVNRTKLENRGYPNLLYMNCRYQVSVSRHNMMSGSLYSTIANFSIPECIQGVCACAAIPRRPNDPEMLPDSEHVTVSNYQPISDNRTDIIINWVNAAWNKKPVYFRVVLSLSFATLLTGGCENPEQEIFIVNTTGSGRSKHNITYRRVLFQCKYYILIRAYDSMACEIPPLLKLSFDVEMPTTKLPTTSRNTSVVNATITWQDGHAIQKDKSGKSPIITAVAIIVPMFLILLVVLFVFIFAYKRGQRKSLTCQGSPSGLHRRAIDNPNNLESHIYHRNLNQDSTFLSINENSRLLVNLPPKCVDGGLEVNPAYIEHQIQESIRLGQTDEYEFGFHRLEIGRKLGKGAFGHVFIADAYGINGNPGKTVVAVKILKENASVDEKDDFRAEINFMKTIGKHENIITILGCCTLYEPLCLVVEYVPHGDLLHYLRDLRKKFEQEKRKCFAVQPTIQDIKVTPCRSSVVSPFATGSSLSNDVREKSLSIAHLGQELWDIFSNQKRSFSKEFRSMSYVGRSEVEDPTTSNQTVETTVTGSLQKTRSLDNNSTLVSLDGALDSSELQSFAYQIACGMDYLSMKGVLHRDLAARNILVGDDKVLKISDFGLSREGVYVKRSTGKIPLRWLSAEAIRDRLYSTASDVWAFGIVLWEICTLGGFPYPTVNDKDLLKYLLKGNRMEKPTNCTDDIYQLMKACWSAEANERPSFQTLRELLWDMLKSERPYVNVDPSQAIDLPPDEGHVAGNLMDFSDDSCDTLRSFNGDTDKDGGPSDEQNGVPLRRWDFTQKPSEVELLGDNESGETNTLNDIPLKPLRNPEVQSSDSVDIVNESTV